MKLISFVVLLGSMVFAGFSPAYASISPIDKSWENCAFRDNTTKVPIGLYVRVFGGDIICSFAGDEVDIEFFAQATLGTAEVFIDGDSVGVIDSDVPPQTSGYFTTNYSGFGDGGHEMVIHSNSDGYVKFSKIGFYMETGGLTGVVNMGGLLDFANYSLLSIAGYLSASVGLGYSFYVIKNWRIG